MNYFFIDYENVKNLGLEGVERLESDDTVIVFYSQNANTITFDTHQKLCESKAEIIFERVNVGVKNSLDFQLATYLGYIIGRTEDMDAGYYLVTKDMGFSVIGKFWRRRSKRFSVIDKISDMTEKGKVPLNLPSKRREVSIDAVAQAADKAENADVDEVTAEAVTETVKEEKSDEVIAFENDITVRTVTEEKPEAKDTAVLAEAEDVAEELPVVSEQTEEASVQTDKNETQSIFDADEVLFYNNGILAEHSSEENHVFVDEPVQNNSEVFAAAASEPDTIEAMLAELLDNSEETKAVIKIVNGYKTKSGINNALVKKFQSKKAGEIYKAIKPFLKDKKGSEPKQEEPVPETELHKALKTVLDKEQDISAVEAVIQKHKTRTGINNALVKAFPSQNNKTASDIYKAIKPFIKDKKGSEPKNSEKQQSSELELQLEALLDDKTEIPIVVKIVNGYKTKSGINNALVKKFQSKKAGEVYKAIKPLLKDKKG